MDFSFSQSNFQNLQPPYHLPFNENDAGDMLLYTDYRRRRSLQRSEEAAVGEIRGGDTGLDAAEREGVAGDVRHGGGGGAGLRPGGVRIARVHGGA
nr:ethylene-responsive transcription factor 1B-like [Ipomoea batatas]